MSTTLWTISVKTVGGSESVKAAKATAKRNNNNSINNSSNAINRSNTENNETSSNSMKDPPVDLKSPYDDNTTINNNNLTNSMEVDVPSNFTVLVDSEDKLSILHDKIEEVTGLEACQQRLIYRGRLITKQTQKNNRSSSLSTTNEDSSLIRDIDGLCDGQTIHLVPRPLPLESSSSSSNNENGESATSSRPRSNSTSTSTSASASASATSLLATLLGLSVPGALGGGVFTSSNNGGSDDDEDDSNNNDSESSTSRPTTSTRAYGSNNNNSNPSILSSAHERRRHVRALTSNAAAAAAASRFSARGGSGSRSSSRNSNGQDPHVWERNALEPIRQGLMTLHTLLESHPHTSHIQNDNQDQQQESNEEITTESKTEDVDENKYDDSAMNEIENLNYDTSSTSDESKSNEADLYSKRRWYRGQWLDVKDTVDQWLEATIVEVVSYRDVFTPDQIQEYHNNAKKYALASTVENEVTINNAASKVDPIVGANDVEGRKMLFLEEVKTGDDENRIQRLRKNVQQTQLILVHYNGWPHRWDEWIRSDSERIRPFRTMTRHASSAPFTSPTPNSLYVAAPTTYIYEDDDNDRAAILPEIHRAVTSIQQLLTRAIPPTFSSPHPNSETSNNLDDLSDLPWLQYSNPVSPTLDLINEDTQTTDSETNTTFQSSPSQPSIREHFNREQIGQLAPLLDRLGRTLTDAAPHIAAFASSLPQQRPSVSPHSNDSNFHNDGNITENRPLPRNVHPRERLDYAHTLVNTTRDENPSRRSRHSSSSNSDSNSFLGTYLAARGISDDDRDAVPTLARLLRVGSGDGNGGGNGNGGGGIDIHIHAIVTPVTGTGATGMDVGMGLGDTGTFQFAGLQPISQEDEEQEEQEANSSRVVEDSENGGAVLNTWNIPEDEEDEEMALFSDLYTESPPPFRFLPEEEPRQFEDGERQNIHDGNNTNESMSHLTGYSMVVGDIPEPSSNEENNIEYECISETSSVSNDVTEDKKKLNEENIPSTNNSVSNIIEDVQPECNATPQSQQSISMPQSQGSLSDTSLNTSLRGPRRGTPLGRFMRSFRRRPSGQR